MTPVPSAIAVALILGTAGSPADGGDEKAIEGRWIVTSVELAGASVPGLERSILAFADGKKTFTLPDKRVENGTYRIDPAKRPREIDSTTEGREGTETGIYAIDGDELKLCLATRGGARPTEFKTEAGSDRLLITLRRDGAAPPATTEGAPSKTKASGSRAFRMGFTGFVHDFTPEAVASSRKFVRENGDILAHHIEGVPWAESLAGKPFPKAILDEWEGKKSATPRGGKVYLAISPGRGELKVADKAAPLPAELRGKSYDDPLVKKAYLAYCRRAVEFFKPDWLAIGIETNEIRDAGAKTWRAYAALHKHVYTELKEEHPKLPIFASWTLHNMFKKRGAMLAEWKSLASWNDVTAVSYYPFFMAENDRIAALDWMSAEFAPFKKPFAIVETNDAAERLPLPLPQARVTIEGTPQKQEAYCRALLERAQSRRFAFVVLFVHQDYDALWEKIKAHSPELFMAWRDCGLLDEKGRERPAYRVWKEYFSLPLAP